MLSQAVSDSKEAMKGIKLDTLGAHHGITYYEFAAAITPLSGLEQPIYSETSKLTFPLFAMEYALKCVAHQQQSIVSKYDTSSLQKEIFQDPELNDHFIRLFKRLDAKLPSHLKPVEILECIPSGLTLISVWDVGINKAVFHFLPALWGHLDRSFLWLFLSLDHDANSLLDFIDIDENECKVRNDKDQIMCYRIRLHYFLRFLMLVNSKSNISNRQNVCSVFAMTEQTNHCDLHMKVKSEISVGVSHMQSKTLIDTENIALVHREQSDVNIMKSELDKTANRALDSDDTMPISFIFLRSLFYQLTKMYITKDDLRRKAAQLGMSDNDVNDFCKLFMSSGSFIDVNQIDVNSPYVIMKPMRFMCELDKMFYPRLGIDSRVTDYGLVTEETAKAIFGPEDYQFFMEVLVSVDLAIKLKGDHIYLEGSALADNIYYYMPDVRSHSPKLHCNPSALHLLLNVDCPLSHLQVLFARAFMSRKKCSYLVLEHSTPVNITRIGTKLLDGATDVNFEMSYLGDTVEFHFPNEPNENICTDILESCNEVMEKDDWMNSKYSFSVMPPDSSNPNDRHRCNRHILFSMKDCDFTDDSSSHLVIWKRALMKVYYIRYHHHNILNTTSCIRKKTRRL